jgi:glycosyltransferase involved in cell wall biosynthesis
MSIDPLVSVIIPVFNRTYELKRALESVVKQSYRNLEIIVIDDSSSVDIQSIVDFCKDCRIKYLRNDSNKGVSFSRNRGIVQSHGEYIAFLDSDDEWLPKKVEKQLEMFRFTDFRLIHTEEIWIRNGIRVNQKDKHRKSGGDIFERSLCLCLISPSSVMLKRDVFDTYGLFDEKLPVCEDYDLWLRITSYEPVGFIETPLIIKYGGHKDQLSKKFAAMDKYRVISLLKLLSDANLSEQKKEAVKKMIYEKSQILYNGAIKRGNLSDAELYREWLNSNDQKSDKSS